MRVKDSDTDLVCAFSSGIHHACQVYLGLQCRVGLNILCDCVLCA